MARQATYGALQHMRAPQIPWVWVAGLLCALIAGLAPPFVSAALLVGGLAMFLMLRKPVWGAYALVLSVPVQKAVSYDAGPIEITVTQSLFVVVLGIWWAWLALRADRRLVVTPIAAGILFFIVGTLPSLWATTSLTESLAELSRWVVTLLSYVIIVNSVESRRQMRVLVVVMLVAGMSEALLGLVQAYSGAGPASFNVEGLLTRAYGTIGAPNSFAGYVDLSVPLALALALYSWARWAEARRSAGYERRAEYFTLRKLGAPLGMTLVFLVLFWTVITTLSRGAWIGLLFGAFAMILALGRRAAGAIAALFTGGLALAGLGIAGALPTPVTDRVELLLTQLAVFDPRGIAPTPENYAVVERMVHWQVAGNMFLSSPWVGVGFGNFNVLFNKFGVQGWPYSRGHAHNYYLNLLAETGVVGLTFYLLMLITVVVIAVRAVRFARGRGDLLGEAIAIGALGIFVTFIVHNLFENLHALNFGIHWGAALALFTLIRLGDKASEHAEELLPARAGVIRSPTQNSAVG